MTDISNLRETITPKSDQLNADDLIGTTKTITVTSVKAGTPDQPVSVNYEGDSGRPYKPCKSMRRVMIHAWGEDGRKWVGQSMTLYCDPEVKFGGVKVGGIRISHMTGLNRKLDLSLTVTKARRAPYTVHPLVVEKAEPVMYPADQFDAKLPAMRDAISSGKMTAEKVIEHCEKTGNLTVEQKESILSPIETDKGETY